MIRVFVADDHEVVRQGLRRFMESTEAMRVVGEASDGEQAVQALESQAFDVLLLDLSLPLVSGLDVLRRARKLRPEVPVVILSMYPEEQFGPRMRAEGAATYLSKERPLREVVEIIRALVAGTLTDAPQVSTSGPKAPHQSLSPREYQIFTLLARGRTSGEIAVELNLAPSTVSNTIARIRTKLNARSVADIVTYAMRAGLIA